MNRKVRSRILAGECTRAIDLKSRHRDIESVQIVYKEIGKHDRHFWRHGEHALVSVLAE